MLKLWLQTKKERLLDILHVSYQVIVKQRLPQGNMLTLYRVEVEERPPNNDSNSKSNAHPSLSSSKDAALETIPGSDGR